MINRWRFDNRMFHDRGMDKRKYTNKPNEINKINLKSIEPWMNRIKTEFGATGFYLGRYSLFISPVNGCILEVFKDRIYSYYPQPQWCKQYTTDTFDQWFDDIRNYINRNKNEDKESMCREYYKSLDFMLHSAAMYIPEYSLSDI